MLLYTHDPIPKIPVHIFHLENIVKSCFWGPSEAEGPQHQLAQLQRQVHPPILPALTVSSLQKLERFWHLWLPLRRE
jgi:hypothetical protein